MIGETISHYRITKLLGAGGMGVVYEAEDTKLKRTVALKFLPPDLTRDPEAKARFVHEAQAASALDHPNVCTIHEIGESEDGQLFLAMACYEGETLKEKIARGPLKLEEAMDLAKQIAEGLAEAHGQEIVHRDLKPANIFVTKTGLVKILDFGLAKLAGQTQITQTGTTLGTVAYMSPEQARCEEADARTDFWSLGVVLYEMIVGRTPFQAESQAAVVSALQMIDPEPVTGLRSGVPLELERVIDKCLAKNPEERYQHADEIVADLRRATTRTAPPSKPSPGVQRGKTRRPMVWGVWVIAAAVVAALAIGIFSRYRAPQKMEPVSARKMLAVLPFENLGSAEDDYFAAGITEEITSRLATIRELGVISRTSADLYAGSNKTIKEIGAELGVGHILEGTVRWARGPEGVSKVRITPQLIRVLDDTHLWSERYDRVIEDIFKIQSDIAQNVVEHLGLALLDSQHPAIEERPTDNLEAYQAYLQAQYWAGQPHFSAENWERAIQNYERAVGIDPEFALAYAKLSAAHARLYYFWYDFSPERREKTKAAVDKAIVLAPDAPETHLASGYYYLFVERDVPKAFTEFDIAARDLPDDAAVLRAKGDAFREQGRWPEAVDQYSRACELNPRSASLWVEIAECDWFMRRYPQALEKSNKAIALAPAQMWPYLAKAFNNWSWKGSAALAESRVVLESMPKEIDDDWVYWSWYWQNVLERDYHSALSAITAKSDGWIRIKICVRPVSLMTAEVYDFWEDSQRALAHFETARDTLEFEVRIHPEDPRYHSALGITYAALGRRHDAIREGKRAVELLPMSKDAFYGIPYVIDLAHIYTLIGDHEAAVKELEHLLSVPTWFSSAWLEADPRWNRLRNDPAFRRMIQKYTEAES